MNKKSVILNKILNSFVGLLLIFQSFAPGIVYAQEATSTATVETTPSPSIEPTPTPSSEPQVSPSPTSQPIVEPTTSPEPSPSPSVLPEASPTLTPSPSPSVEPSPTDQVESNSSPEPTVGQPNAPPQESPNPSQSPQPSPSVSVQQTAKGHISATILENTNAQSLHLDLSTQGGVSSASLSTDKADYAPTDTAVITGSDFPKGENLKLIVTADNYRFEETVKTNENGQFIYIYQLDGTYRPLYIVEAYDLSGLVLATVTFTDSDPENVSTLAQLNTALADTSITTINITANITGITSSVVVGRIVTINGGGFTLGFTGLEAASGGVDDGLLIQAPATINNLIVNAGLAVPTTWAGTYAIQVYNTSATLNGVTATNGNGGILVNGSAVILTGITTVSGNGFGGIEVSASIPNGLPDSILTVTGTLVNSTEAYGKPTIWLIDEQGTVTGANVPATTSTTIVVGQTQYYLSAGNAVDPIVCTNDAQGANDEPGQKDLTKMCADYSGLPTALSISWNWDDVSWGGSNTGDACSLYDTDGDGKANYALCVGVNDNPAVKAYTRLYSCTDTNATKCTGDTLISASPGTSCSTSLQNTDPFVGGSGYPSDTVASCTVTMADVGGSSSTLLDVCSYPSGVPHSDSSDCIIASTASQSGTVELKKVWSGTGGQTTLQIGTFVGGVDIASQQTGANGAGPLTTGTKTVNLGTYYVSELGGLTDYTPSLACTKNGNSYTPGANNSLTVGNNDVFICTFTNTRINNASITIVKDAQPNDAQDFAFTTTGSGLSGFSLDDDSDPTLSNTKVFSSLEAGTYSVSEGAAAGWTQTSAICSDGSLVSAISLQAGENVTCTFTNTRDQGTIELKKAWSGTGGQTTLNIGTSAGGTQVVSQQTGAAGADPLTTGTKTVNTGTYYVSETGGLTDYNSSLACTDNSSPVTPGTNNSLSVTTGHAVICTFTNTRNTGTLRVLKNVDLNGDGDYTDANETGATDWKWKANAGADHNTGDSAITVNTGNYALTETPKTDFHQVGLSCSGGTLTSNSVAVTSGANVVCTFTNAIDTGTVIVHKDVQNPTGGAVTDISNNFKISLDSGIGQDITDNGTVTYNNVPVGSHTVTESLIDSDYTLYGISSVAGTVGNTSGLTINVTTGTNNVYVTNRQKSGTITVIKDVINPDGGAISDTHSFTVNLSPGTQSDSFAEGDNAVFTVNPGTYTASETTDTAYTNLGCLTATGKTDVVVGSGESVTITCTNQQKKATITVVKDVVKSDLSAVTDTHLFHVTLNGETKDLVEGTGLQFTVNPGTYSAVESADGSYTLVSNDGPATVVSNGSATINIVNKQNPGTISGYKYMAYGTTGILGWTINLYSCTTLGIGCTTFVTNTTTASSGFFSFTNLITGFYQVLEDLTNPNYTPVSVTSHDVEVTPGATIQNQNFSNFKNINIMVCKKGDADGSLDTPDDQTPLSGWTMTLTSGGEKIGTTQTTDLETGCTTFSNLGPGRDYSVTETLENGWTNLTPVTHDFGTSVDDVDQNFTFVNFKKATIIVHKNVVKPDGTTEVEDPTLFTALLNNGNGKTIAEETDAIYNNLTPGTYTITEDTLPTGYALVSITDDSGTTSDGQVTVTSGLTNNVTITNRQLPATLTLVKRLPNDNGGTANQSNFKVYINNVISSWGSHQVDPDSYTVKEDSITGYTPSSWGVNCDPNGEITLLPGESKTCEITNDDIASQLTVIKHVITDNGGTAVAGNFTMNVTGTNVQPSASFAGDESGTTVTLNQGSYSVDENAFAGYAKTIGDNCSGTINVGEHKTCTITNYDIQPKLTVTKVLENKELVDTQISDFPLSVGETLVTSGDQNGFDVGSYVVSEQNNTGYLYTSEISGACDPNGNVTLAAGDEKSCTITNTLDTGTITVNKVVNSTEEDNGLFNLQIDENTEASDQGNGGTTEAVTVIVGTHSVGEIAGAETSLSDYVSSISCDDESESSTNGTMLSEIQVNSGDEITCTITNIRKGTITGFKWHDLNGNGRFIEEDEPKLSGWHIQLFTNDDGAKGQQVGDDQITDQAGNYTFSNVLPGNYFICENLQGGWNQTYPDFDSRYPNCWSVVVEPGEQITNKYFGNQILPPVLTLTKANDKSGIDVSAGANVIYTLTVSLTGSPLSNVSLIDLPPAGFKYRPGSWTASSNLRGNLSLGPTTEPTYASPGTWNLGNMQTGETVTLTYIADIDGGTDPGLYKDLAWSKGTGSTSSTVLANESSGFFVGTEVNVVKNIGESTGVEVIKEERGEVLGASIELPATGANAVWLIFATFLLVGGAGLMWQGMYLRRKYE